MSPGSIGIVTAGPALAGLVWRTGARPDGRIDRPEERMDDGFAELRGRAGALEQRTAHFGD